MDRPLGGRKGGEFQGGEESPYRRSRLEGVGIGECARSATKSDRCHSGWYNRVSGRARAQLLYVEGGHGCPVVHIAQSKIQYRICCSLADEDAKCRRRTNVKGSKGRWMTGREADQYDPLWLWFWGPGAHALSQSCLSHTDGGGGREYNTRTRIHSGGGQERPGRRSRGDG